MSIDYEDDEAQTEQAQYPWQILADGGQAFPLPVDGHRFSLQELQGFVGGSIEYIKVPKQFDPGKKLIMVVNESGRLRRLPVNHNASFIVGTMVVGDVLVCEKKMLK
jgi:hypothetical protein